MATAVVIGVGNRWRRDDAAGLEVIDALQGRVDDSVLLVESDGEPASDAGCALGPAPTAPASSTPRTG